MGWPGSYRLAGGIGQVDAQTGQLPSRRDRVRAATRTEILQTARKVLLTEGSGPISLRAIAREMGMTAPAIYRYFDSHEELIRHVVADLFVELTDHVHQATVSAVAEPWLRDRPPDERTAGQLIAACRAFRDWALAHRQEFGLIFGSPLPALDLPLDDPCMIRGLRFGELFLGLFSAVYRLRPFPVPADDEIDPSLRSQLIRFGELTAGGQPVARFTGSTLPIGALQTFLRCWVLLYGSVSLEVFGQLRFALDDAAPMFELVLSDMAERIGFRYPFR